MFNDFKTHSPLLTDASVKFDFYESIVLGGVLFQHLNMHETCPYVIQGELVPMLTFVRCPPVSCSLDKVLL